MLHPETRWLSPYADPGKTMEEAEYIQHPEDHGDYDDAVQNGLDRRLHGNEAIDQPQKDTYDNENFDQLNQRHDVDLSVAAGECAPSFGESRPQYFSGTQARIAPRRGAGEAGWRRSKREGLGLVHTL